MLVDGRWVPTFPNAKYLFSRIENEIGDPRCNPAADADLQRGGAYRDSVFQVIEAGQAVLVDGDHALDDSLTIVPASAYTPSRVAVWLAKSAGRAVFTGDVLHHALQIHAPHWNSKFCELLEVARRTRRLVMEQSVEHRAALFPGHFGAPRHPHSCDADRFSPQFVEADAD